MNKKKLSKLRKRLKSLRAGRANVKSQALVSLAKALERELSPRGKHPMYVSRVFPYKMPISIPKHSALNPNTVGSILDDLEKDIFDFEEMLSGKRSQQA